MPFSIGRAGLTLALPEPLNWQNSGGGTVTLTGSFVVSGSVTDSLRLRDQLLGLAGNGDEAVVPLISGAQPRDTGYYRVISVDIPTTSDSIISGIHYYTIVLQPVFGYTQPMFESIITGALSTNAIGAVGGDMIFFHSVPSVSTEYNKGVGGAIYTRSSADGNLLWFTGGSVSDTARFWLVPSNYYAGAGTFEQGNPLQPVVGRQLAQNDTVNWRLSNGLVRVTPSSTAGKLDVRHWSGGAAAQGTANILSPNESSFESGIGSFAGTNCTVAQTAAQAADGTKSLAMTASSGGDFSVVSGQYPVQLSASTQYTAVASVRTAVTARTVQVGITQYDASRAPIRTDFGTGVVDASSGWIQATLTITATLSAAYVAVQVYVTAAANAEVHYLDKVGLVIGASTVWQIGGWAMAKTYQLSGGTPGLVNGISSVTVMRNSPEETIIRLNCTVVFGINWGRVFIDLALRRGDRIVRGYLSADAQSNYKIARSTTEAAAAITYGAVTLGNIRATANDADGNRYVLMSIGTATPISDLVNGAITQNAAVQSTMDFGIGSEIGGSGAIAPDDAVSIAKEYLAVQSEKQQTVNR